jgi:hypothetical protein
VSTLNEDHKEIASGKKKDDEGYMARSELQSIERSIEKLRQIIKKSDTQLPAWVQSKITRAADYIDTAAEYLQSDKKISEEISPTINVSKHKTAQKKQKIVNMTKSPNENEAKVAKSKSGPSLPFEQITLTQKILGEELCGKGMYWCNTDKVCKPIPEGFNINGQTKKPIEVGIGKKVAEEKTCNHTKKGEKCPVHGKNDCSMKEERDPKGPVQPYKSPEEIAKKHKTSLEQIQKELKIGIKVEGEHTSDKTAARITALQHLDKVPDYYTKLKQVEKKSTKSESVTIEDMFGNKFVEFVDLIKSDTLKTEDKDPCWKGYTQVGMKEKNGKEVPNCVPVKKGVKKAKGYQKESIEESVKLKAQNGNIVDIILTWRGKTYSIKCFFPQTRMPGRKEVNDEIQKIYPGGRVLQYTISDLIPGQSFIQSGFQGGNAGKLGPNRNYIKTMGEEVEIEEAKKSEMPCNKPKAEAHGSGETGKSHVVKACEDGKEKLIRFGQKGVKGSPKKEGESEAYANRRKRFKDRHEKNIAKGKMSAAYWANKVKW